MKVTPEEPAVAAAVAYFLDMAKGKITSSRSNGHAGLGAVRHPSTYHVIPNVQLVTPSAQALAQAKDSLPEAIRGQAKHVKRSGAAHAYPGKRKKSEDYSMPGLD